jgi:hypothetical protein
VTVFEEFVLMLIVECVPLFVSFRFEALQFGRVQSDDGIFCYALFGVLFLLLVPFNVVPAM